jgi:hypothetical protein
MPVGLVKHAATAADADGTAIAAIRCSSVFSLLGRFSDFVTIDVEEALVFCATLSARRIPASSYDRRRKVDFSNLRRKPLHIG